jgi:hypothetical protein
MDASFRSNFLDAAGRETIQCDESANGLMCQFQD